MPILLTSHDRFWGIAVFQGLVLCSVIISSVTLLFITHFSSLVQNTLNIEGGAKVGCNL